MEQCLSTPTHSPQVVSVRNKCLLLYDTAILGLFCYTAKLTKATSTEKNPLMFVYLSYILPPYLILSLRKIIYYSFLGFLGITSSAYKVISPLFSPSIYIDYYYFVFLPSVLA